MTHTSTHLYEKHHCISVRDSIRVTDTESEQGGLPVRGRVLARAWRVPSGALVVSRVKHGHAGLESTIELKKSGSTGAEVGVSSQYFL